MLQLNIVKHFLIFKLLNNYTLTIYFLIWAFSLLFFSRVKLYEHLSSLSSEVSDLRSSFIGELTQHSTKLLDISVSDDVLDAISRTTAVDSAALSSALQALVEQNDHVLQATIMDASGQELIVFSQIHGEIQKMPTAELNSNATPLYLRDTLKLDKSSLYISPVDLTIDEGLVTEPHQPVIRIATPLITRSNEKWGVIELSIDFQSFIDEIALIDESLPLEQQLLINSEGEWLRALERKDDWAYLIPNKYAYTQRPSFINSFPIAWRSIKQNGKDYTISAGGLFAFEKIYLISDVQNSFKKIKEPFSYFEKDLETKDYYLILISYSAPSDMLWGFLYHVLFPHLASLLTGIVILGTLRFTLRDHFRYSLVWDKKTSRRRK